MINAESWEEPLSDESDRASRLEAAFTEHALEAVRARSEPETDPEFDGEHCLDCGEQIPPARLALGRIRCVHCQHVRERNARLYTN